MVDVVEIESQLISYYNNKDVNSINELINKMQFADIATVLERNEKELIFFIFSFVDAKTAAAILSYLSPALQKIVVEEFSQEKLVAIVDNLYSDDLIDIIDKLPHDLTKKILNATSVDRREDIHKILKYDEDTAGGMMTVNYLELYEDYTISRAMKLIRENAQDSEIVNELFVVNKYGVLKGSVNLKDLIINNPRIKISKITDLRVVAVDSRADREEVISLFKKYDKTILPVVNSKNKIIGLITVDDVIDGLEEETTEDITKLAGIQKLNDEYFNISIWKMFKSRATWLVLTLLLGTISQILIIIFSNLYRSDSDSSKSLTGLAMLAPMLLVLAANIGVSANQSTTIMVRAISIGDVNKKDLRRVFLKELLYSLLIGTFLVLINTARLIIIYSIQYNNEDKSYFFKAILVSSLTLYLGILIGNILGTILPIWAKKLKLDPTLACSPFITTILDIVTVSLLLGLGLVFFGS